MPVQKKGLGRGLDALFSAERDTYPEDNFAELDINLIEPNDDQPRKYFDTAALEDLASSIREFGILQPLIVTKKSGVGTGYYRIVAGERRYRAARMAKLSAVPVIIRDFDELDTLHVALVENLQRKDLNPLEEALSYKKLIDEFSLTQEQIADKVAKSRSAIANSLRLLSLDKRVHVLLRDGKLSAGHCRALLGISDLDAQFDLAERIIENELSVRQTEDLITKIKQNKIKQESAKKTDSASIYKDLEDSLMTALGTKVNITRGKTKGKIEIEYYSDTDLDRLFLLLKK